MGQAVRAVAVASCLVVVAAVSARAQPAPAEAPSRPQFMSRFDFQLVRSLALVFQHVSRHLGDRPKREAVAMNAALGRLLKRIAREDVAVDVKADAGPVVARAWVDYTWLGNVNVTVRRPISPAAGVYARGFGETYGVDETLPAAGSSGAGASKAACGSRDAPAPSTCSPASNG